MERIERDKAGKIIDKKYNYIDKVTVTYLGKTVASFDTTQSVSENPFFAFAVQGHRPRQAEGDVPRHARRARTRAPPTSSSGDAGVTPTRRALAWAGARRC